MNIKHFLTTASVLGLTGIGAFAPTVALAQDSGEEEASNEIIVSAQRREEKSVDVPITVTTLSADALATANVDQLSGIAKMTPGLRFDFAGAYFQPTIRGVGTPVTSAGSQGNVGIYVDGFYVPNPLAADFDLMKVRNIQVLKGPQGTLFGRNTTGGGILVQTADPSTTTSGQLKLSYGRYNEFRGQAYATFGLGERVAMDVEGSYRRGDGYLTNISNNQRVGEYENWSARVGLKAELSDSVSVLLRYQHSDLDDPTPLLTASYRDSEIGTGHPYYAAPGQFTFDPDKIASGTHPSDQEFYRAKSDVVQGTIKADLGFADLTSYTQYRKESADASIELDYSGVEYFQLGLPNDNATFTQELLLSSKTGSKLQWVGGLFYFQNRDTYRVFFDYFPGFPPPAGPVLNRSFEFGSSATAKSYAAFLDMTYEVTPKLFITAGARYAYDEVSNSYAQCAFCPVLPTTQAQYDAVNGGRVTPRVVVRYKPTDDTSIYASYTRGYKSAILDFGRGVSIPVKPETIDAFEVGFKLDNNTVSFETSAFYYDYKNLQVSLYETGTAIIINAANSEIYGLDAQMRWRATDNFMINAGAAWVHARYKEFNNAPVYQRCAGVFTCGFGADTFEIPGNVTLRNTTMQRTPEFTANIGATYKADVGGGELALSGNLFYTSSFFFGPSGIQFKQNGYEVLALRAQWTDPSDKYTIAVFGDNVTNKRYKTQVQYALSGIGANWSKPATWGVELGAKF